MHINAIFVLLPVPAVPTQVWPGDATARGPGGGDGASLSAAGDGGWPIVHRALPAVSEQVREDPATPASLLHGAIAGWWWSVWDVVRCFKNSPSFILSFTEPCTCLSTHARIHSCTYPPMQTSTHTHIHPCTHPPMHLSPPPCTHPFMHTSLCAHPPMHLSPHAHIYLYTHPSMCTSTHAHIHPCAHHPFIHAHIHPRAHHPFIHVHIHPWKYEVQSGLAMPLSRHSVGTYWEMSSHATRLLSHCGLILA